MGCLERAFLRWEKLEWCPYGLMGRRNGRSRESELMYQCWP